MVSLDRCNGICDTHDDLSSKICVRNKAEETNLSIFNMVRRINESKTSTKHIICNYKRKFDGRKLKSNQKKIIELC